MSQDDLKKEIRQLLMLISTIRSKDNERYEEHVKFSNEIIDFIKKIQDDMNKNWEKIHNSLAALKKTVDESLDALLTSINPKGIQETSKSLKEIMDTMSKSMQTMNLENIMRELRALAGGDIGATLAASGSGSTASSGTGATPLTTSSSSPYATSSSRGITSTTSKSTPSNVLDSGYTPEEIEEIKKAYGGELPPHLKYLEEKEEKEDPGLLKPSDFFGS